MPEYMTDDELDDITAELVFAEEVHRGNTGTAGKYGVAALAIAELRERLAAALREGKN